MKTRVQAGERLLEARRRLERALQVSAAPAQQASRDLYVPDQPEYLTLAEGARLLRFDATAASPVPAFRKWLRREAVPVRRRGRVLLVERRELEAALRG